MTLSGTSYIAGQATSSPGAETFAATDPATATELKPTFHGATEEEVDRAVQAAERAFADYRALPAPERARFLETIAERIEALGDTLIERCRAETGLPTGRLTGERGRTVGQLRLFAEVVREGSWVDARIERGEVDIRSMLRPLGPVAVFGASNFPLAFSVAGGDTASALAAGCPVVFKAHPSHPGTCELVGRAIGEAVEQCGLPAGTFSLVQGHTHAPGLQLVRHPLITAVGFTGSFAGGKALFDAAGRRPVPIPVYAEMGSTNPVFLLPRTLVHGGSEIAEQLANSVTLGVGQFCTNPGLIFLPPGQDDGFVQQLGRHFRAAGPAPMLNHNIYRTYERGSNELTQKKVRLVAEGPAAEGAGYHGRARLFSATANAFLNGAELEEEVFGPSSILIASNDRDELLRSARRLRGHLTATVFGTEEELADYHDLIGILERKVGRLIINGVPTGVAVNSAMVHGGPFPATTDSRSTSVGTRAIVRFARPVCYQDFPEALLPEALRG